MMPLVTTGPESPDGGWRQGGGPGDTDSPAEPEPLTASLHGADDPVEQPASVPDGVPTPQSTSEPPAPPTPQDDSEPAVIPSVAASSEPLETAAPSASSAAPSSQGAPPVPSDSAVEAATPTSDDSELVGSSESTEPPAAAGAEVDRLTAQLAEVMQRSESAERRGAELTVILRRQSDLLDELRTENHSLREGEIREAIAPLVRGLARLSDDLGRIQSVEETPSPDIVFIEKRVSELLHDCGVMPERPSPGDPFDPHSHQATGSAPTDNEGAHMTVAEIRRAGLRRDDGRVLRPADVVVFRYRAPAAEAAAGFVAAEPATNGTTDEAEGEG